MPFAASYEPPLTEDAEQAAPAVLAGGVMMDTVANDHIDDAIHALAVKHSEHVKVADVCLDRVSEALDNGCLPLHDDFAGLAKNDISGLACTRLAVGHRLAR